MSIEYDYFMAMGQYNYVTFLERSRHDPSISERQSVELAIEAVNEAQSALKQLNSLKTTLETAIKRAQEGTPQYNAMRYNYWNITKQLDWLNMQIRWVSNYIETSSDELGMYVQTADFNMRYGHIDRHLLDQIATLNPQQMAALQAMLNGEQPETVEPEEPEEEPEEDPSEEEEEPEPVHQPEPVEEEPVEPLIVHAPRTVPPEECSEIEEPSEEEDDITPSVEEVRNLVHEDDSEEIDPVSLFDNVDRGADTEVESVVQCFTCGNAIPREEAVEFGDHIVCQSCAAKLTEPVEPIESLEPVEPKPEPKRKKKSTGPKKKKSLFQPAKTTKRKKEGSE